MSKMNWEKQNKVERVAKNGSQPTGLPSLAKKKKRKQKKKG